jgi:hypothetical protein
MLEKRWKEGGEGPSRATPTGQVPRPTVSLMPVAVRQVEPVPVPRPLCLGWFVPVRTCLALSCLTLPLPLGDHIVSQKARGLLTLG